MLKNKWREVIWMVGKAFTDHSKEALPTAFRSLGKREEINKNGGKDLGLERFKKPPDYGAQ